MLSKTKTRLNYLRQDISYYLNKPKRLLFDHLPKCAGTTLQRYLSDHYPERLIFRTYGKQPIQLIKEFQSLPQKLRYNYQLIIGHSTHDLLDFVHPDTVKMTVLRDPIDRIISHYFYVKQEKDHHLHERVMKSNISLEDYVTLPISGELQNWYAIHFTGLPLRDVEQNPEEALHHAIKIITNKYNIIGFQDDLPKLVEKLRAVVNLTLPFENEMRNKTRDRTSLKKISETAKNAIAEVNSVDIQLFNYLKRHTK